MRRMSFLTGLAGLALAASGCAPAVSPPAPTATLIPPASPPAPAATLVPSAAAPSALPPADPGQPALDNPPADYSAGRMAVIDLANRLSARGAQIEISSVQARAPEAQSLPCLADPAVAQMLAASPAAEVQWVTLRYKGQDYHYLAWLDEVVYCEK